MIFLNFWWGRPQTKEEIEKPNDICEKNEILQIVLSVMKIILVRMENHSQMNSASVRLRLRELCFECSLRLNDYILFRFYFIK